MGLPRGIQQEPRVDGGPGCLETADVAEPQIEVSDGQSGGQLRTRRGVRAQGCRLAMVVFLPPPPGLAYVALCQAPRGASLLPPGWGAGSRGEGVAVAASRLRHRALNWDPLSSSPGGFQLSLPLCGRGAGDSRRGTRLRKHLNGVGLFSPSILLSEFQSPLQAPCLPSPAPCPSPSSTETLLTEGCRASGHPLRVQVRLKRLPCQSAMPACLLLREACSQIGS